MDLRGESQEVGEDLESEGDFLEFAVHPFSFLVFANPLLHSVTRLMSGHTKTRRCDTSVGTHLGYRIVSDCIMLLSRPESGLGATAFLICVFSFSSSPFKK